MRNINPNSTKEEKMYIGSLNLKKAISFTIDIL